MTSTLAAVSSLPEVANRKTKHDRTKPPFEVKKMSEVALWVWDMDVDNCAICKNHIYDLCTKCEGCATAIDEQCTTAWGVCNHGFHLHCMTRWLVERNACPLCNRAWEYQRVGHYNKNTK